MMRLADQLREQAVDKFRHCYVRYEALLAQLQAEAGGSAAAPPPLLPRLQSAAADDWRPALGGEGCRFEGSLLQEVQRMRLFVKSLLEQLWLALLDACGQLRGLGEELLQAGAASSGRTQAVGVRLAAIKASFDAMAQELELLERFLRQNVAACAQLAQMHDQPWAAQQQPGGAAGAGMACGGELPLARVEGEYLAAMHAALLGELRLEPLLVGLSDGYELCRAIDSDAAALAGRPDKWVPPDRFQRVTRKFWLHPADVLRFKAAVMRHLPVLLFGDRRKLTEGPPCEVRFLRDQAALSDSSLVSSVYYDCPDTLAAYTARLRKEDTASVVRLRWYGERSPAGSQRLFVERKVHRERFTGELSYKERAPIAQRDVAAYTSGTGVLPEMLQGPHADFLRDAQQFLLCGRQVPLLRTVYRRTAFQESSTNLVRISLDTQLHMVREAGAPRAPGDWCRDMGAPLPEAHAAYFPYAVVEIKLQDDPPPWVQGLLQTGMLLPVPKFSKFLHGTAVLFQRSCTNVPYWFLPDESDPSRMTPTTWEEMADPADEYLAKGADWLFPKTRGGSNDGCAAAGTCEADGAAVPYRPAPLRFLRRKQTAPADCRSPASSGDGLAAAAGAVAVWGSLQTAGGAPALLQQPHPAAPPPAVAPGVGSVPRNLTWPVYNNPLALLPPSEPSTDALSRQPLAAVAVPLEARPPGPPSQTSTPQDSAQDLEAGQGGAQAGGASQAAPAKRSSRKLQAEASPSADAGFAALEFRLTSAPPGGNGSGPGAQEPRGRAKALVRTRVEPKTFFASERTFLQWLQISVLIMMTATSMLSGTGLLSGLTSSGAAAAGSCDSTDRACFASKARRGGGVLSGAVIAPVGLLFMAYALYMYRLRTYQILRRETARYDDPRGTVVLTCILGAVFLLSYVMAMVWIF